MAKDKPKPRARKLTVKKDVIKDLEPPKGKNPKGGSSGILLAQKSNRTSQT